MKKGLVEILACPTCKSPLTLSIKEEKAGEVHTGSLHCPKCKVDYPIVDSIPNLLPRTPSTKS